MVVLRRRWQCRLSLIICLIISFLFYVRFGRKGHHSPDTITRKHHRLKHGRTHYHDVNHPILLWWTGFTGEPGRTKRCGTKKCFFTANRSYWDHPKTKVFLFYGTDFKYGDLPIPREPHHEWGLLHEESPKNVYLFSHEEILGLFNHTATFRRESDMPLTLQYLQSIQELETKKYLLSIREKNELLQTQQVALVNYVQSDCGSPSDRDHFVQMLQRHIEVDSYGLCEHNKDLPEHLKDPLKGMDHEDFYHLLARYKFTVTFENAVCDDYVTEKFWRPFEVGSVPIVFGSPSIKDFLPDPKSAILVSDFENIKDLARHLNYLHRNETAYEEYLHFKTRGVSNQYLKRMLDVRGWGVSTDHTRPNMVDAFECFVCERVHANLDRSRRGAAPVLHRASRQHYGCPRPQRFADKPTGSLKRVEDAWWSSEWNFSRFVARALRGYLDAGRNFTEAQVLKEAYRLNLDQREE